MRVTVRPSLEEHVLAVGIGRVIRRHHGRVQHRKARRHLAVDVVLGVAEFCPQGRSPAPVPVALDPELQPPLVGHRRDLRSVIETADFAGAAGKLLQESLVARTSRIGHRSPQRRHVEAGRIAETAGGGLKPIDFGQYQAGAVQVAGGDQEPAVALGEFAAIDRIDGQVFLGTLAGARAELGLQLEPVVAAAGDEVHDAGHRFGAVNRGGAVLEDLHALDGEHRRQAREVHETETVVGLRGGKHLPPAVHEHQRGGDAQSAQIDVGRAHRVVLRQVVGIVLRARVDREDPHHVANVLEPRVRQVRPFVDRERRRRIALPADAAAGPGHDDDLVDRVRVAGLVRLVGLIALVALFALRRTACGGQRRRKHQHQHRRQRETPRRYLPPQHSRPPIASRRLPLCRRSRLRGGDARTGPR